MAYLVKVFRACDREWVLHKKTFTDKEKAEDYSIAMYNKYNKEQAGRYDTEVIEVPDEPKPEKKKKD